MDSPGRIMGMLGARPGRGIGGPGGKPGRGPYGTIPGGIPGIPGIPGIIPGIMPGIIPGGPGKPAQEIQGGHMVVSVDRGWVKQALKGAPGIMPGKGNPGGRP